MNAAAGCRARPVARAACRATPRWLTPGGRVVKELWATAVEVRVDEAAGELRRSGNLAAQHLGNLDSNLPQFCLGQWGVEVRAGLVGHQDARPRERLAGAPRQRLVRREAGPLQQGKPQHRAVAYAVEGSGWFVRACRHD